MLPASLGTAPRSTLESLFPVLREAVKTKIVAIYSENADFQILETLQRNRNKRNKLQQFFVEGVRPVTQAMQNAWKIQALIYSPERRLSNWAENILQNAQAQVHYALPLSLMQKLSQKDESSELMAIVSMPEDRLERISEQEPLLLVVFDRPSSPGNLGTVIRTSDALGVQGMVITGHAVDLYDPETIRATTGSFFALPVVRQPSHQELLPWFDELRQRHNGLQIVGTSSKARLPIHEFDFTQPILLLIGNENHGLSEGYKALADAMVTIPMSGSASSLNAACAASILLYEITRQRRFK